MNCDTQNNKHTFVKLSGSGVHAPESKQAQEGSGEVTGEFQDSDCPMVTEAEGADTLLSELSTEQIIDDAMKIELWDTNSKSLALSTTL